MADGTMDYFKAVFEKQSAKNKKIALGFAWGVNGEEPECLTSGPVHYKSQVKVAEHAQWHIGSISKSFTSSLIMRLVEQGVLDLDEPIGAYLARFNDQIHADWQARTLRMLLSHSAGVPANASRKAFFIRDKDDIHSVRLKVLRQKWQQHFWIEPGNFHYSNLGYVLAGFIAEEMTGKSWEELIKSEIAQPLGLNSLGFGAPIDDVSARGHQSLLFVKKTMESDDSFSDNPPWLGPAGTIHLNLHDLVKWGRIHLSASRGELSSFLSAQSALEMQKPIKGGYGLGWLIDKTKNGENFIWHNGSNTLWYAKLVMLPEKNAVFAAATNIYQTRRVERLLRDAVRSLS